MTLTLVGSTTSPYVRRLRLYLDGIPHTFEALRFLDDAADDARLAQVTPIKRIPVLLVDGEPVFESRVIFNYLQRTYSRRPLSMHEENIQSCVDTLQDSLIQPFLLRRLGHAVDDSNRYWVRTREREQLLFAYLERALSERRLDDWYYPAVSLWCLLDWATFRNLVDVSKLGPSFKPFYDANAQRPLLAETDPRKA